MTRTLKEYQHPLIIRITHWVNFIALSIMVTSGLRIYNASPIWDFEFPPVLTLGGWLAGARMWHFFGMWLFVANGLVWFLYNITSRHGRSTTLFRKSDLAGILPMVLVYLRVRKQPPTPKKYNALQKLAYTTIPVAALGSILTGLALYWPTQFSRIANIFGGYDTARVFHFLFASALVVFSLGHLFMVITAGWSNFASMITGWKKTAPPAR